MTRSGLRWLVYVSVLAGLACLVSCSDTERHRALSFWFDGVPPLPGQTVDETVADDTPSSPRRRIEPQWFLHEPQADCERCHGDQKQKNFSRQVNLVAPVPTLCYGCHDMPGAQDGWVHGPVASGQCVLCHEPHRALNPHLLKKAEPQICFQCHEASTIKTLPGHDRATYDTCLDCHAGHHSAAKHLLKTGSVVSGARQGRTEPTGDPQFDAFVAAARTNIQSGQSPSDALGVVVQHIDRLELEQARAALMAFRLDMSYAQEDRVRVLDLEAQLEAAEKSVAGQQQTDRRKRAELMAQLYYNSVNQYRAGQLQEARSGFEKLLTSDVVPGTIKQAIEQYLAEINQRLSKERTY
ncbi:MAG: cytochrome c3 family protein [Phycisphaerae bacterium]|nr:cytochrome c3 family protein [Phycisphaerae bacterium]